MAENKNKQQKSNKPESNANPNPIPEDAANTANYKGAVDLGTEGTKATASQQQGQGSWNKKGDSRTDTDNGDNKTGQGSSNKSGK